MGFESLLGNQQLKDTLGESLRRGHISHFYLISGPEGAGKHTLANLLAQAILCEGKQKPCGTCLACRKVQENKHPDFITVDDPQKKTVTVDLIRQARTDIYIQPNEAAHKIYLFPRAQDMGLPGQNALLKVLEEPPEYGVFILLCDSPEKLLPTVRSRCVQLRMQPLPEKLLMEQLQQRFPDTEPETLEAAAHRSGGFLGQAAALLEGPKEADPQTAGFVKALCGKNFLELTQTMVPMEKWKREELTKMLESWLDLTESALASRCGIPAVSPLARSLAKARTESELNRVTGRLKQALEYTLSNVSPGAVCAYLAWTLIE